MVKKIELPEWQQDAQRLKALFEHRSARISQEEFGRRHGIGSQGMVSQYLNGKTPLTTSAARKFAVGLGVDIESFSPSIASAITQGDVARVPVTIQLRPELRGKMMQIAGLRSCGGKAVHLYELYEEALEEYIRKHSTGLL